MTPEMMYQRDQTGFADGLIPGTYVLRRRGHVDLAVQVSYGPPADLEHGGDMDRSPRWEITLAGHIMGDERGPKSIVKFEDVWPRALGFDTPHAEAAYLQARRDHAIKHSPTDPFGHRRGKVDLLTAKVPF